MEFSKAPAAPLAIQSLLLRLLATSNLVVATAREQATAVTSRLGYGPVIAGGRSTGRTTAVQRRGRIRGRKRAPEREGNGR